MKIRLENITKVFKNIVAVKELNVAIEEGALVCLLGPSGCGKSTTLSMVAGLEVPTEGEIFFGDNPMSGVEAEDRDIGMVFQNYALYPHMTVMENIMFPLKMRKVPKNERIKKAENSAAMMQIMDLLKRKPVQLSGGQQQRVAIARALVKEPAILLLDEPFSNLDARLRIELRDDIRALQKKLGITTIFVTHDQEEAMSISDYIILMKDGELQQFSTPQEMYSAPENAFVAGFLGNPPMNFLQCDYIDGEIVSDWKIQKEKLIFSKKDIKGTSVLGIRPEDLKIVENNGDITGKITAVQTLGKEVYLKIESKEHIFTVCTGWSRNFEVGERLEAAINKCYLFPNEDRRQK